MPRKIKVKVVNLPRGLVLRWTDHRGKQRQRKVEAKSRRAAEREAAALESSLNTLSHGDDVTLAAAIAEYDRTHALNLAASTRRHWGSVKNSLTRFGAPDVLSDFTASVVGEYSHWLETNIGTASVASYLKRLRAFLNWCQRVDLIHKSPYVAVEDSGGMRGRPLLGEEVDRLIAACEKVVGPQHAKQWQRLINGLLLTSLRLSEGIALSWTDEDTFHVTNIERHSPVIRIPNDTDKAGRPFDLPLSAKAIEFLRTIPAMRRSGLVFPLSYRNKPVTHEDAAGKVLRLIGRSAGVIVSRYEDGRTKYASAQDLRVTFATKLAEQGVPFQHLHRIMRHSDPRTTLRYYVSMETKTLADAMNAVENQIAKEQGQRERI